MALFPHPNRWIDLMRRVPLALLATTIAACSAGGAQPSAPPTPVPATLERFVATAPDSIALERQPCFGSCPVYRVSLDRTGRVRFGPILEAFPVQPASDSISPHAILYLMQEAERASIGTLPLPLAESSLCAQMATDMPTAEVYLYAASGVTHISDYHGCLPADPGDRARLEALRAFERSIDAVTGSYRWSAGSTFRR